MNETEKIQTAYATFQAKMAELKKRRHELFARISEKMDKQHMEALRKKLQDYE